MGKMNQGVTVLQMSRRKPEAAQLPAPPGQPQDGTNGTNSTNLTK